MKFTRQGGQVRVSLHREGSYARLAVSDYGDRHRTGVFAVRLRAIPASRRLDHARVRRAGSGSLDRAAPGGAARGTVEAASAGKDQGASFTVKLPLEAKHAEALAEESRPRRRSAGHHGIVAGSS